MHVTHVVIDTKLIYFYKNASQGLGLGFVGTSKPTAEYEGVSKSFRTES
jgi:hypothetical protein